jgi:hydroxymethylbilane synthase
VAVEIRSDDRPAREAVSALSDRDAAASLTAERAVVAALGGGCQLPLGVIAEHEHEGLRVQGVVAWPDGRGVIRRTSTGLATEPAAAGTRLADELLQAGADEILNAVRTGVTP